MTYLQTKKLIKHKLYYVKIEKTTIFDNFLTVKAYDQIQILEIFIRGRQSFPNKLRGSNKFCWKATKLANVLISLN